MITLEVAIPESSAYLVPIGDIHIGDRSFGAVGRKKLMGYLHWVQDHPNARIFLMGDVLNCATRSSKTSPFESVQGEYDEAKAIFEPFKNQILGAIEGNHETRLLDHSGFSITKALCDQLGILYCGYSAALKLRVGLRPETENQYWNIYWIYAHHTNGGGGSIGNALNRVVKLQEVVAGMDVYLGGHNHQLANGTKSVFLPGGNELKLKKMYFVDCGSYLDWNASYAEQHAYPPSKLGSPRIRFSGERDHPDVHVSV